MNLSEKQEERRFLESGSEYVKIHIFPLTGKLKTRYGSDECEKDAGHGAGWIDVDQPDSG
jgi:hypothetical protein